MRQAAAEGDDLLSLMKYVGMLTELMRGPFLLTVITVLQFKVAIDKCTIQYKTSYSAVAQQPFSLYIYIYIYNKSTCIVSNRKWCGHIHS